MVGFLGGMALLIAIGASWAGLGGLAGFYQEANTEEWANLAAKLVAPSQCQACHPSTYAGWAASGHRTVNCQNCHGPAAEHIQGRGKPLIENSQELCGFCHSKVTGRPADFPQVGLTEHAGQSACITCHRPHGPQAAGLRGR